MTHNFWFRHALLPVLIMAPLLIGLEFTDLDRRISDLFYDAASHSFPLRDNFWLEVVMHHWLKDLVIVLAMAAWVAWAASFRIQRLALWRAHLLYLCVAMTLASAAVTGMKALSSKHCPYDLDIYGGHAPYVRLFESEMAGVKGGHCFPGGHASTGFVLLAFYFTLRARRPRWAMMALQTALTCGMVLGFARVVQGAHFLTHQLWTAVICWYAVLGIYWLMLLRRHDQRSC